MSFLGEELMRLRQMTMMQAQMAGVALASVADEALIELFSEIEMATRDWMKKAAESRCMPSWRYSSGMLCGSASPSGSSSGPRS